MKHSRLTPLAVFVVFASACAVDDAQPAAETGTDTTGDVDTRGESSTSTPGTTGAGTLTSTSSADTSGDGDEDTAATDDDSGGFVPRPDGGFVPSGICVGIDSIGYLATVHRASDTPVDPSCSARPAPCGGDIIGSWTVQTHCGLEALPNLFEHDCPGSTMTYLGSDVQGMSTFGADLSFSIESSLALDVELGLDPMACFGTDCMSFGELISAQAENIDAVCSESPEGECSCLMTITSDRSSEGTYELTDDGLVLTVDGEAGEAIPMCVDGDRLQLWEALHETQDYPEVPCTDTTDCEEALGNEHEEWLCVQ